jgi:hypothetical protein
MAFCPKCGGSLGLKDVICPHCGYDFPPPAKPWSMPWWLHLGMLLAAVAIFVAFQDNVVVWVIGDLLLLAFWVSLFLRVWRLLRDN